MSPEARVFAENGRPGREEFRDALAQVLGRPEFQVDEPSAVERAWTWVQDTWRNVQLWAIEQVANLLGGNPDLAKTLLVLLFLLLAALLAYIVWSFLAPSFARRSNASQGRTTQPHSSALGRADDELRRAFELGQAGRFAEAMHALYQGVLLWLDEAGHARYEEGKTGAEYAREITQRELRPVFRRLLKAFYPVAYGGRPALEAAWSRMSTFAIELGVQR